MLRVQRVAYAKGVIAERGAISRRTAPITRAYARTHQVLLHHARLFCGLVWSCCNINGVPRADTARAEVSGYAPRERQGVGLPPQGVVNDIGQLI